MGCSVHAQHNSDRTYLRIDGRSVRHGIVVFRLHRRMELFHSRQRLDNLLHFLGNRAAALLKGIQRLLK